MLNSRYFTYAYIYLKTRELVKCIFFPVCWETNTFLVVFIIKFISFKNVSYNFDYK